MKIKDFVLHLTCSILTVLFGVLLLLDQLNIKYIDDFFTPWYLIVFLYIASLLLAFAIVKKAPIFYVFSMLFAGIYLIIALPAKVDNLSVAKIIFILPLFVGLGVIIGDLVCGWSAKALRWGLVITISSAIILVSSLLDVWKIVIPVVVVLLGISRFIFVMIDAKSLEKNQKIDESIYVTPSKVKDINDKTPDNNVIKDKQNQ